MSSDRTDVAVVGAGPAGAWAAYTLARQGARVTLFDGSHPREKPCGGGVTGRALERVAPAVDVDGLPAVTIDSVRFEAGRQATVIALGGDERLAPRLTVVPRAAFDAALLAAAQRARVRFRPERVTGVDAGHAGVTIATRSGCHRADWVIGADGATSLVRRRLYRPFARGELSIATGYYARGCTSHEVVVRFTFDPPGYLWSFPRPDHLAIGICAQADEARPGPLRGVVADWIARSSIAPDAPFVPYTWPIPSLPLDAWPREHPAGARWMLAGDAAGLVDPLTREGIYFALESGALAAWALGGGDDPSARYLDRMRDELWPELSLAARFKAGFYRRRFVDLLMLALADSRRVRAVMADLVTGRQPYATLKRRLVGTFEPGLAWRLMRIAT